MKLGQLLCPLIVGGKILKILDFKLVLRLLFCKLSEAVAEAAEEVSGLQETTTFTETTEAPGGGPAQGLETGLVGLVLVTGLGEVEVGPGRETAQETAMTAVSGAQGIVTTLSQGQFWTFRKNSTEKEFPFLNLRCFDKKNTSAKIAPKGDLTTPVTTLPGLRLTRPSCWLSLGRTR